jgi:rubrerythrin
MPSTKENLKTAFAGESQANQKYLAFAKKAERDGFPNIARLFRTTAEAERIHAEGHLKSLEGVGSTLDNLEAAIAGETYEFREMYPPMLEQAEKDGHKAARMFKYAVSAEEVHARLYKMAMEAVKNGKDLDVSEFYLCPVCGYIEFGKPPEKCPICGALASKFVRVQC